jgi:hypothetical protein
MVDLRSRSSILLLCVLRESSRRERIETCVITRLLAQKQAPSSIISSSLSRVIFHQSGISTIRSSGTVSSRWKVSILLVTCHILSPRSRNTNRRQTCLQKPWSTLRIITSFSFLLLSASHKLTIAAAGSSSTLFCTCAHHGTLVLAMHSIV